MKIDLSKIFEMQAVLDKTIQNNHNVTYPQIFEKLKFALLVETCELANEIRFFKYWSNKQPSPKNVILEEYVDGIHFITSLCLAKECPNYVEIDEHYPPANKEELTEIFLDLSSSIKGLNTIPEIMSWYRNYLILGVKLGFNISEILESYINKNKINFQRQENNY